MEKAMRSQRIPDTDSIEELSRFWDTHDLTGFEHQLEEVRAPVLARRKEATVAIALTRREAEALKRLAQSEGVKEAKLVPELGSRKATRIVIEQAAEQLSGLPASGAQIFSSRSAAEAEASNIHSRPVT